MNPSLKAFCETGESKHLENISGDTRALLLRETLALLQERRGNRHLQKKVVRFYGLDDCGAVLSREATTLDQAMSREAEFTVALTGAASGSLLIGIRKVNKGAILKLQGTVYPSRRALDELRGHPGVWSAFLSRLSTTKGFSKKTVEERGKWLEVNEDSLSNGSLCDAGAMLKVIQPGGMINNMIVDKLEEMMGLDFMDEKEFESFFPVKGGGWRGKHTLVLFRKYWRILTSHKTRESFIGRSIRLPVTSSDTHFLVLPDIASGYVKRTKTGRETVGVCEKPDTRGLPINKWQRVATSEVGIVTERCPVAAAGDEPVARKMRGLSPGAYKSFIQKIIRFRPMRVLFPECLPGPREMSAEICLAGLIRQLCREPGSFVPDIQRFVTGAEAGLKRTGVSAMEDSWAPPDGLVSCLAAALLAQRVQSWEPGNAVVEKAIHTAIQALRSNKYWAWASSRGAKLPPCLVAEGARELVLASALLDELKAFKSDLDFVRDIAAGAMEVEGFQQRPELMSMEHCVDQHWAPDFAYFFDPYVVDEVCERTSGDVFGQLFSAVWNESSGVNPRKQRFNEGLFRKSGFVQVARNAQKLYLISKQGVIRERSEACGEEYEIRFDLPSGWLSSLVGCLEIRNRVVTLGADDPRELTVIRKPSRNNPNSEPLPDEEKGKIKREAVRQLRNGVRLNAASPPVPVLKGAKVYLTDAGYEVSTKDGRVKWEQLRRDVALRFPPLEPLDGTSLACLLTSRGDGVTTGADELLEEALGDLSGPVLNRTLHFMSGFSKRVEMNRVGRSGAGTVHSVLKEDVTVYQFLLFLSGLYPSALRPRPGGPGKFDVPSPPLLWHIRDKMRNFYSKLQEEVGHWDEIGDEERVPKRHQIDALNLMKDNCASGNPGSFLWMTVGSGKTMVVLMYVQWLIRTRRMPPYFVYTLPKSALASVIEEIKMFGLRIRLIIPLKSRTSANYGAGVEVVLGRQARPEPYTVTLVTVDTHLRMCVDALVTVAPRALLVFDEVHKSLNDSQRTSAALNLASLSRDFVAFTGTPVVDSKAYKLIAWLQKIVPFEVNRSNYLVAANAMISKQVKTNVKTRYEDHLAMLPPRGRARYERLVPPSFGGTNTNPVFSDWRMASEICYEAATRRMVELACSLHSDKGRRVCLVAKDMRHQEVMVDLLGQHGYDLSRVFVLTNETGAHLTPGDKSSPYVFAVVPITRPEGYTLTLMNAMVTSVYPSNLATRTQIEGRINRLGQTSESVEYHTVHVGILTRIMNSHRDARSLVTALEEISRSA